MSIKSGEPPSPSSADSPAESLSCPTATHKAWRPANPFASFCHAADGIAETFQHERNFRFHLLAALVIVVLGVLLHISLLRMVAILGSIALVLITELLNTAIEATVDLAMPAHHPLARRAKDAGAGAVLVAAVFAAIVGALVFIPALIPYVRAVLPGIPVAVVIGVLVCLVGGVFVWVRRSAVSSLRSSRKIVIGVMLAILGGACSIHWGTLFADGNVAGKRGIVSPSAQNFPALPSSAGVS